MSLFSFANANLMDVQVQLFTSLREQCGSNFEVRQDCRKNISANDNDYSFTSAGIPIKARLFSTKLFYRLIQHGHPIIVGNI